MGEDKNVNFEGAKKKRGRKAKGEREEYILNKEQTKFFIDLSRENEQLDRVQNILVKANAKSFGREITFKDLTLYSIEKLTTKDIDRIKESSLSEMEKVERSLKEYNQKYSLNLSLGEYLLKRLNLN